ncbi:DUF885 domain-containing protein [Nocardioides iriomotensis]|uniref:DUF885 domain-containing protein n=1 Tax=Nocardioides iriomotensis TaxID=715784 RepID=A0A4Q5J5V7_9ACTN|nr:DUF885 domain-containing protein [Nocardioides iriomotensis]RYU12905.1 DUF885 domain-containing protein [Nocardioides iriomotensis]
MSDPLTDIDALADEYWAHYLDTYPTEAHLLGDYAKAGRFEQASRAAEDREIDALREFARRADAFDDGALDEKQRITRAVLAADATSKADLLEARLAEIAPADPIFGMQVSMPIVTGMLALPTAEVAEALADTYRGVAAHYRDQVERLREGKARGWLPAAFAVEDTVKQIDAILDSPVSDDGLLRTTPTPDGFDADAWRARLEEVISSDVRPAMAALRDALRDEVLADARPEDKVGLRWLEGGDAAYDATLRYFTTTTKTAQEIHDLGLAQVEKLADEYRALGPEVVGSDDLATIFDAMRNDPKLHFSNGQDLVDQSEVAMQRAWDAMPDWFETLPQAPCGVAGTMTGPKAFYFPPATDGSRGGTFFVNIDDPDSWGIFELESMAFHEGIPGHHLQLAIAGELQGVPEFRKHIHNSAYAEGWGLYTERLSDEMGLYSGPVDRMGMYAADSMRACRLVVDTGLHALGWSRQQAIDFMVDNSPLKESMCRPEIDRYIVSPGQATSYMVGRVEIQRMRAEAEARQGDGFSIKAFHSAVLDNGSLPLGVLDDVVRTRLP